MKNVLKNILLLFPIIYSIIKLKSNIDFYIIFSAIYIFFVIIYFIYKNKNYYYYLLQIGITCIFLDLTFHNIDFKFFFNSFKYINFKYLFLIIPLIIVVLYIRAFKWKYLLNHIKPIRISSLFKTILLGFMVNSIYPARAGELYRAFFLNKLEKIDKSTILSTVILERAIDGLVIGIAVIFILMTNLIPGKNLFRGGVIVIAVYLFALILLILFFLKKEKVIIIIKKNLFFLPLSIKNKLVSILNSFYEGLHIFKNLKDLFLFVFFTFIIWTIAIITDYFFLKSMGIFQAIDISISPILFTILLLVCMIIGVTIPGGPGGLGPLHYLIKFAFLLVIPHGYFKINPNKLDLVLAFAMYIWLVPAVLFIASGFIVLTREHLKLKLE